MSSLKVAFYLNGLLANVRLKALHGLHTQEGWDCGEFVDDHTDGSQFLAFLSHGQ